MPRGPWEGAWTLSCQQRGAIQGFDPPFPHLLCQALSGLVTASFWWFLRQLTAVLLSPQLRQHLSYLVIRC